MQYPGEFPATHRPPQHTSENRVIAHATNLILLISLMAIQYRQIPVRRIADVILRELQLRRTYLESIPK